ncbi:SpoIIE family protein phosphatase [Paractinoplanes lichenicola]|uniref:SpoIIE family protein phosphatase n=1 Tax=Paractinoplanes lichenicola TaxID=2802976 RepID=UPI0027DDAA39|nr:SpoIIE family protein phosphatase [Actinoplanes lichenicola]
MVRRLFEQLPLMVCALEGPELRFVAATSAYRAYAGRPDITGTPFWEAFPETLGQRVAELFERVIASGRAESLREWRFQFDLPDSGGETEVFVDLNLWPLRGADDQVTGVIAQVIDVTTRVREQQRVAEAEKRFEQARDVIDALQRQLLPNGLPVLPEIQIAASYLLADADAAAGGDWFDAVPLAGGKVALVVGDVVGHGVSATAAMGQLRAVLHDRLDETGDVLTAIAAADRMARRVADAQAATVCITVLDPASGALTYCSAGHPPPLIAGPNGARFVPPSGQGPLGTGAAYSVRTDQLAPEETVLLYTDGIIERPGRTPAEATVELSQVVAGAVAGPIFSGDDRPLVDRLCAQTMERLVRETGHSDDITLMAAQRRLPVPTLKLTGPDGPAWLRVARTAVDAWVTLHNAGEQDRIALLHAAGEVVTNSTEHARPDDGGTAVTITAELLDNGEARLVIADNGRWQERPRPGDKRFRRDHGFGLAMAAAFADRLDVDRRPDGTTVTVRRRLSRSAQLLRPAQINFGASPASREPEELLIVDQPDAPSSRIALIGPIDVDTIQDLGPELDRYTLGGTHDLVVDLSRVTHLASAGVAELYRTAADGNGRHYPLTLYAPAGSTAHHVLSLVDLPHTTTDPHPETSRSGHGPDSMP